MPEPNLLIVSLIIVVGITVAITIIKKKYPEMWLIFNVSILGRKKLIKDIAEKEKEGSKGYIYESFEDFLRDAPKYSIDTSFSGTILRGLMKTAGVSYQQYVFIRKNNTTDKTAYLRRGEEDKTLINGKGTYYLPWDSEKDVIYYDIIDARPLIDLSEDADWKNPDAVADNITALVNNAHMAGLGGDTGISKYTLYILIAVIIAVLVSAYGIYYTGESQKQTASMLAQIINSTSRIP